MSREPSRMREPPLQRAHMVSPPEGWDHEIVPGKFQADRAHSLPWRELSPSRTATAGAGVYGSLAGSGWFCLLLCCDEGHSAFGKETTRIEQKMQRIGIKKGFCDQTWAKNKTFEEETWLRPKPSTARDRDSPFRYRTPHRPVSVSAPCAVIRGLARILSLDSEPLEWSE